MRIPPTTGLAVGACSVLAIAWLAVCAQVGSAWPWSLIVHEDGRRTLLQTLLYVEHGLRELPLDLVLAGAIAGSVLHYFPEPNPARRAWAHWYLLAAVLCVVGIGGGALLVVGPEAAVENLAQAYTRTGAPPVVGAHWRYHLLSRLALMAMVFAMVGMVSSRSDRDGRTSGRPAPLLLGVLGTFGLLTVGFGVTREPFVDTVSLGHQARELFTHTLVTVPLALAACLACVSARIEVRRPVARLGELEVAVPAALSVALGAYLALGVMATDAVAEGQATSISALLFPHIFEHTLTYVLVGTAAPAMYLFAARPGTATT